MLHHPHLTALAELYQSETQPFRKVHRMIDLFESIIKTHTVVILGEYVKHNKLSDAAKGMLAQGLRTPSLGTWQLFSRVMFEELKADGYAWAFDGFFDAFTALDKALNADKTNVIAFRNGYAHGATPTDAQCQADIEKFEPFLNKLLQSQWLTATRLETRESKVWVISDVAEVCVHPVLLHKADDGHTPYAFFNDLKNDRVGLLNYPLSKHYREKEFYKEFHEYLPLHEWKKTGNNEFFQRIEELTETFKGRTQEREQLLHFVREKHKGYFSIQGNPGIGKSALIAQFFKDLRANDALKNVQVVEYFIRRGTAQAQIEYLLNYLIKRTDELFAPGKEIRAEGKAVWDLQQQLFAKWRLWGEQSEGKKLLFLIDGLDEGTENNVVSYMPRENFEGVLIIYGSRPGGHKTIDELWTQLPTEHHTKLELAGLSREDIRALIYEVANKYEVERDSDWIEAVQKRSQGNPLYLKLLCDAIENGSIALNDIDALPKNIDEYYKAILQRYAYDAVDGDALLAGLFTFAAAKDYLTMGHLGLINKLGDATIQRIGSTLKEVLYENPLTEEVLDYQLFHESFREYLIKEKPLKVNEAAERIIDFCGNWQALEGTWEQRYALEHYAKHLSESKKEARGELLMNLLYDAPYAAEQKKVLKNFDASNRLYQTILLKANGMQRFDDQLEAALCLVDLKYEEANDAPQVIAMVANGEIDLALKRIESFGGTDKEGVKRRFTLYMLCLMELTLLESKTNPFRKTAIEKLLNHLDEQIPVDQSILNWNHFFPSYLMFLMACELAELGLDYLMVYKRSDNWKKEWLTEKGPYSSLQFEVLLECARGISSESVKSYALEDISIELAKQGKVKEALACARRISSDSIKSRALHDISAELAKQGQVEEAASTMQEVLACARGLSDESDKSSALKHISTELAKQGQVEEALACARGISSKSVKSSALKDISTELAKQGQVEEAASAMQEALACARGISSESVKSSALKGISTELAKQGQVEEAASAMQEALACARSIINDYRKCIALNDISTELAKQGKIEEAVACAMGISDDRIKSSALEDISIELAKQGKVDEALTCARGILNESDKSSALMDISTELAKQGQVEEAASTMQEALACARGLSDESDKSSALKHISTELAKQGQVEEALACARGISYESVKSSALKHISTELAKQGQVEEAASAMQEALACARGISYESDKSSALKDISSELAKQGQVEEAASAMHESLACKRGISDDFNMNSALKKISTELTKQGKLDEALTCARSISNDYWKSIALKDTSIELANQGKVDETASSMQEALTCARSISLDFWKISALKDISAELGILGKVDEAASVMQEALACARVIRSEFDKTRALQEISIELAKQGMFFEAENCVFSISNAKRARRRSALSSISSEIAKQGKVDVALAYARHINDDYFYSSALKDISIALAKQGKIDEALACLRDLSDESHKSSAMKDISTELAKQGKVDEAASVMQEAFEFARSISDESDKSSALKDISIALAKQGKIDEAASAMQEALACARGISDESDKSSALKDISTELAKQSNMVLAEKTGLEIQQLAERHRCWKAIAEEIFNEIGWKSSLEKLQEWKSEEAHMFYLKGWVENLSISETGNVCLFEALPLLTKDSQSIENLLQGFAFHEVFFGDASKEKINRLNRSLNIQRALDVAAQFPNEESATRLSTKLDTWLHEIADEDDREQIELWAKQVAKGKITEEEFGERVKGMC